MNRRGFTLLELIIVIIIIGVLATLGLTQYTRMVERSRGAEARQILGDIRKVAAGHYLECNSLAASDSCAAFDNTMAGIGTDADMIPETCRNTHYFTYSVSISGTDTLVGTATRCAAGGKGGPSTSGGKTLVLTTTYPGGTDIWGGTGGY
jgi:prepilin-type N-terminal cleavage/methylation domain-containing protein